MAYDELALLLKNFDDNQLAAVSVVASRLATAKQEKVVGRVCFEFNLSQGSVGDSYTEVERLKTISTRKRRVR